ncbi:MAG TPA: hypothetical protein VHK91_05390 [Flavisolibacter sp.]|jgi:hypothetical protein|nr:hypothetical protein [Flavisolibacter sp.]
MKYSSLFFFLLIYSIAQSQKPEIRNFKYSVHWKKGETAVYSISRIKQKEVNGTPQASNFNFDGQVYIKDSTSEGYTIEFLYKPSSTDFSNEAVEVGKYYKDLKLVYTTNSTGSFLKLLNWEEVRDFYVNQFQKSIPASSDSQVLSVIENTKKMFSTEEAVENSLIKEIQLFHSANGGIFSSKGDSLSTSFPNPFGGADIPSILKYQIKEVNKKGDYFLVNTSQKISKAGLRQFFESIMKNYKVTDENELKSFRSEISSFNMSDISELKVQLSSGWPIYIENTRKVNGLKMANTEKIIIKRLL